MTDTASVYIVVVDDRHYDTEATPYWSQDTAVAAAKTLIREAAARWDAEPDDENLNDAMRADGWVYYGRSYEDGPSAWVVKREVQP